MGSCLTPAVNLPNRVLLNDVLGFCEPGPQLVYGWDHAPPRFLITGPFVAVPMTFFVVFDLRDKMTWGPTRSRWRGQ